MSYVFTGRWLRRCKWATKGRAYKPPYDKYPRDYPRQCVFIGTTNNIQFLPNDATGNRRFIPIPLNSRQAVAHPLKEEEETRTYIKQCWAEAMEIYRGGEYELTFPKELEGTLMEMRQRFAQEDPKVGVIQEWLDHCTYKSVCSIMIYREALGNEYQEPRGWELREINAIMNLKIEGWKKHPTTDSKVRFKIYGKQRAWDRITHKNVPDSVLQEKFELVDTKVPQIKIPFI